jgi:hypothetical protein
MWEATESLAPFPLGLASIKNEKLSFIKIGRFD